MVTDSAEKSQENKDDCEKASNTKEIPRWNAVTNISCPRLNELFCCQKVAHSVLFYILIFLFVLVFVYILRKLVSLPSGHAKHNSRKPNNGSTATAVYNHSRDSIAKRLPTKWPKIDTITDHLAAHLTETTTSKDKNSEIYNVPGGSGQSYGWSGFYNNNPNLKIGSTSTGNLEDLQKNDKDYGTVYPHMTTESQGNTREQENKILEASPPSVTNPDSAHASSTFGSEISQWPAWNYPESNGFRKASTDPSFLNNQETSRVENKPSEWPGWENSRNSGFKNTDWSTWGNLENTAQGRNQPRSPAWSFSGYSGSDLVEGSTGRSQQNSGPQLRSHVPTPMANGGNYDKWDYTSSPWVKRGSSWLPGSGFGWFRAGDQNSKNIYGSQSSSPRSRFYSNEWASSENVRSTYKDNNNNPAGQAGDNSNPGYSGYNEATSANIWNPYYNNRGINQTEDWSNFNIFNGQNNGVSKMASNSGGQDYFESSRPSVTTNNKKVNEQYQFSPKVVQEETDDRIHRWPLEEEPVEEPVKKLSSTSPGNDLSKPSKIKRKKSKNRRKSQQGSKGKIQHKPGRRKRKHKKSNAFHSWRQKKKMNSARQTQKGNHFKKSKIPHHSVLKSRLRRRKLKVKTRVKSKVKGAKVKQLSAKVSRLKTSLVSKRRRKKTSINKHKSKIFSKRLPSYASYKKFNKKHQTNGNLVGKWHRTIHHVKRCKTLSKFKIKGKVQLSRQYLHRKRKYRYTVLSCRYVNKEDDENDATDDIGDERDALRSEKQICREFWFITNGKIILRKITKHHSGQHTYTVMLCKKGSVAGESKVKPTETLGNNDDSNNDDDTDVHKQTGNDSHNNDYQDLNADDTDDTDTSKVTANENSDRYDDDSDIDDDFTEKNKETENKKNKNFESDDKTVTNKKSGNEGVDDDKDFDEDDVDKHGSDKTKKSEKKKFNDDNDFDDDFDDEATDSDNDNKHTDTYDSTTDTDDDLTNTQSSDDRSANDDSIENDDDLDDIDIDDDDDDVDDDVDVKNKNTRHGKNRNSHKRRKLKINKSQKETSKSNVKKSIIPKHYRTHKVTKKRKHKTTSKTDATYDNSDVYERLLKGLTEDDSINDRKPALAKLVAAISKKNLNSKIISKRVNNKKLHPHSRNKKNKRKKVKVKKNQPLSFNALGIKNANNIKSFLQNLLTNSNNLQSHSQVERKQSTPDYGPTKASPQTDTKDVETEKSETVSPKPSPQTDTKDVLKLLLPNTISKSTSLTTAVPSPTTQPTKATTHTSDDDSPILNLLNKLGMKSNLNGKVKTALQRLLPSERMKNNLSTDETIDTKSTSAVTTGLKHSQAQPSSLNSNEQLPGLTKSADNSLPSAIPTTIPSQNYLSPLRSPNPSTFTTKSNNAAVPPTPQGPVDETANQSPFGYPAYRSNNRNPYSYQTPKTNVLCFGDSLTSGYYNHGRGKHPYSIRLNQLLNAGGKHLFKIVTRGVVGEMAHGSMTKRLPKILNEGTHFDWVIILGGTNDVAHVKNFGDDEEFTRQLISIWSPKIENDIEKLHEIARRYGARTVILTIPETAYELWPEFQSIRNMRLSVNAALRKYASQVRDTTVLCDLAYKLPRSTLSKELQKFYWNDHIHLNPVGYDKMAEVIGQCIQPYLTK